MKSSKTLISTAVISALALSACVSQDPDVIDPLELAISGKTLEAESAVLTLSADGALTGFVGQELDTPLSGTWYVTNGRFCRTIVEPARLAGEACQNMRLKDNGRVLEVDGVNRTVTYQVR